MPTVNSPLEGEVLWTARPGASMSKHNVIAWIKRANGTALQVFCTDAGVIDKMTVKIGDQIVAGAALAELGPLPPPPDETVAIKKGLFPVLGT